MSELDDFQLDSQQESDKYDTGVVKGPSPRRPWGRVALILLILVAAGAAFWWFWAETEPPPAPAVQPTTPPAPEEQVPATQPALELPPLEASDDFLRGIAEKLSASPRLSAWLGVDNLARRFTASVVNIAEGVSPRSHLEHMVPAEPFTVRRRDGEIVPSEKSYARYDAIAKAVASLDAEQTVRTYRQLAPLFDRAYAELGYPGKPFDQALVDALDHLLATPVLERDPRLVESGDVYVYADPELEGLSQAQRQLLRMGPDNVRRVQGTLAELRRRLLATAPR